MSECSRYTNRPAACKGHIVSSPGSTTRQVVVVEGRNGLRTAAVEIDCAAGNRVRVGAGSERSRNADRAAAGQGACTGGTAGQIVVVKGGNGLRTRAVEINCAAGNRVRVGAGSERARNADRAAAGQGACTGGTAGQIVVVKGGNGLRTRAVEIDCAAGNRV